jgi:REP element-mobilizing transposase RayT
MSTPQQLNPVATTWHITFGTYATRLHGDDRPTVDRKHNQRGEGFIMTDDDRAAESKELLKSDAIYLTAAQRAVIESILPAICERGSWTYRICAAPPEGDHVHVLLDARLSVAPDAIMKWLKRWVGQELSARWGKPVTSWWAECGSTKPVKDEDYLNNVYHYIRRQRTLPQAQ